MGNLKYPKIIQGGMGVNISDWRLARTVALLGQQGTISGVALEKVMVIILQSGDLSGYIRKALANFPFPHLVQQVMSEYYVEGGISKDQVPKKAPFFTVKPSDLLIALTICANYAFVWLAKIGDVYPVSINFLEKIAMPHLYAVFGAMLAEVDFITMGAGIPLEIPGVIDNFSSGQKAKYTVPVIGKNIKSYEMSFDPKSFLGEELSNVLPLKKPGFIPIIASNTLASILLKRLPKGSIYGFVVEGPLAGGHNAPPRDGRVYGLKDMVRYVPLCDTGLPFWIGGACASPEKLDWAMSVGATGIQVGSIFALCEDSAMDPEIRRAVRRLGWKGELKVRTDMSISSSGFPFKVVELPGTISETNVFEARRRVCNRGSLQSLYEKGDGTIGYRCPGELVEAYLRKGGKVEEAVGCGCLCNGLLAVAGMSCDLEKEPPIVTMGDDVGFLKYLMINENGSYTAREAITYLLG